MRKVLNLLTIALLGLNGVATAKNCDKPTCPPNYNPGYNGYCPNSQNHDSSIITFNINPIDLIELHDHHIEFSNCAFPTNCSGNYYSPTIPFTCVTSSFSAATNSASCKTPKKIVGQLDSPMPCCTAFAVQIATPTTSCYKNTCQPLSSSYLTCQEYGFCGLNHCAQILNDGLPHDLITCITCGFSDCNIDISYLFGADICAEPGSFQRTFTLSIVDEAAGDCYGYNGCQAP